MVDRFHPLQGMKTRLKRESSYGVAGAGDWLQLNGLGIQVTPAIVKNAVRVPGFVVPVGNTTDDSSGTGSYSGALDLNGLLLPFGSLFGQPATEDLGGGAYKHTMEFRGSKPNRAVTYTAHTGYIGRAREAKGMIFNSLEVSGARPDGFDVSGNVFSQTPTPISTFGGSTNEVQTITITGSPTGGDFDLTFFGETITVPYNASPATIKTLMEATDAIEVGDVITGGGTLPGGVPTVQFTGYYAGENVATMTVDDSGLTGGSVPEATVAVTTPGAEDIYNISQIIAGAITGDVWIDSTWAGLGTTQSIDCLGMGFGIPERMQRVTPIDSSLLHDGLIDMGEQDFTANVSLAWNAAADVEYNKLVAGAPTFVRQQWTGPLIAASDYYRLRIDMCLDYTEVGETEEVQGVAVLPLSGSLIVDPTSQNVIKVELINTLPGLTLSN